jgi:Flp pilus assembly protein TadG
MLDTAIFSRIRTAAGRFAGANQGNIAVLFAIAAVPILSFVGAAIDYTRANTARTAMQAALDSTALMLAKDLTDGVITTSQIEAKATSYFTALYTNTDAKSVVISAGYTPNTGKGSTIQLSGSGTVDTDFMRVAGFPNLNFNTASTSLWGNTRMRVALVLDNTGSMASNGKMAALQKAATDMIDKLAALNKTAGDVYISIIPFAKDVNVGKANVGASWINWTNWEGEPPFLVPVGNKSNAFKSAVAGSDCPFTKSNSGFVCMDRPATMSGAVAVSKIPSNTSSNPNNPYAGYICPGLDSGNKLAGQTNIYYNGCYTTVTGSSASCGSNTACTCNGQSGSGKICHLWRGDGTTATAAAAPPRSTWTGCVNDRDQPTDATNAAPSSAATNFYAEQWSDCLPATVTPMSNQWQTLKDQITAMTPSGNTNQAIGLAWGWQSVSTTNGPIAAPAKDLNSIYKDFVVLLSDGLNTQNRWSTTQSSIDARQELLCANIRNDTANPVTVFTIQVNINNADPKSQVLQDCATNGNFQMITNSNQTSDAFSNILTQISKLRVAR